MSAVRAGIEESLTNGIASRELSVYNFRIPDLSRVSIEDLIEHKTRFHASPAGEALRETLGKFNADVPEKIDIFSGLADKMRNYFQNQSEQGQTNVTMIRIPAEVSGKGLVPEELSGKTILLIQG
jgi:hypothetical protein